MSDLPEPGRLAAHVLLDAVSAFSQDAPDEQNTAAMNLALRRLQQVGAITATLDDDDTLNVDASNLLGPATLLLHWLCLLVAEGRGIDREYVIGETRRFIDGELKDGDAT